MRCGNENINPLRKGFTGDIEKRLKEIINCPTAALSQTAGLQGGLCSLEPTKKGNHIRAFFFFCLCFFSFFCGEKKKKSKYGGFGGRNAPQGISQQFSTENETVSVSGKCGNGKDSTVFLVRKQLPDERPRIIVISVKNFQICVLRRFVFVIIPILPKTFYL